MKLQVLYVYDKKAKCAPFAPSFVHHIGGAARDFGDQCTKKDGGPLSLHPEDYQLWHAGEWDDNDCLFKPLKKKVLIAEGKHFIVPK